MTGYARRQLIIAELQKNKTIKLQDMVSVLQVSESTVRRDFEALVQSGVAVQIYGGIASAFPSQEALVISPSNVPNLEVKDALCRKVADGIENGARVFVDGGTTFLTMMHYLREKDITIVTNNALLLAGSQESKAELICLGGKYNSRFYINTGQLAAEAVQRYQFDYALITCDAIDAEEGMAYAADVNIGSIKQLAMHRARKSYLVSDQSKFHKRGLYGFARLEEFDRFFTDPSEYLAGLSVAVTMVPV